jgi:hypothetical protein
MIYTSNRNSFFKKLDPMKIKIATIALIFMLPLTTYALSLGNIINSKAISGQQIEQMTKDLDLNPNQVIQINALLAEKGSNYKIINEKLKTILSKDQINKLAALKLKHFQKIRGIQTHLSN